MAITGGHLKIPLAPSTTITITSRRCETEKLSKPQILMALNCIFYVHTTSIPTSLIPSIPSYSLQIPPSSFLKIKENSKFNSINNGSSLTLTSRRRNRQVIVYGFLPVDPWAPNIDSQSIASQLFAFSLFPYLGFLYFITKSKTAPKLTLFGFYFLLAFVGATSKFFLLFNFRFLEYMLLCV